MVSPGMRRYRVRTDAHASLVGAGEGAVDGAALFGRHAPLRLEIGFGHGEFISQMAAVHPEEDFLGVEYDHLRVTKTAHKCLKLGVGNVRLFGGDAHDFVRRLPAQALARVYILFPDPWPKAGHRRRRLVNRGFLADLARACAPACRLLFASDTHNYALQVLSNATTLPGLWRTPWGGGGFRFDIPTRFPTTFERHKKEEGCSICYLLLERTLQPVPTASAP